MSFSQYLVWFVVIPCNLWLVVSWNTMYIFFILGTCIITYFLNLIHLQHLTFVCIGQYTWQMHFLISVCYIYRGTCFIATSQCQLSDKFWLSEDVSLWCQHQRFYVNSKRINCPLTKLEMPNIQSYQTRRTTIKSNYHVLMTHKCGRCQFDTVCTWFGSVLMLRFYNLSITHKKIFLICVWNDRVHENML